LAPSTIKSSYTSAFAADPPEFWKALLSRNSRSANFVINNIYLFNRGGGKMKFVLAGLSLALFVAGPVIAADMPVKAPYYKAPLDFYSWTGFYVGANGGYGWGNADTSFNPLPTAAGFGNLAPTKLSANPRGPFGGIQGGYNFQTGSFVWGLEADFQGAAIEGTTTSSPIIQNNGTPFGAGSALTTSENLNWFGTVRGRLGFTPTSHVLVYGTGGLAYGNVSYGANSNFLPIGTQQYPVNLSTTKTGWTAGGGLEWAFLGNWTAKVEYLFYNLGDEATVANGVPGQAAGTCGNAPAFCQVGYSWRTTGNLARAGLNYKF